MRLEIFTLCDAANESFGKLNMLGTFDRVFTHRLPTVHPSAALVMRVRLAVQEKGQEHNAKLVFLAPSRALVLPDLEFTIEPDETLDIYDLPSVNIVFNLRNIRFVEEGKHTIEFLVNDRRVSTLNLWVNVIENLLPPPNTQLDLFREA